MKTCAHSSRLIAIQCNAKPKPGERVLACSPVSAVIAADAAAGAPIPDTIVWMPRGDHEISAGTMAGGSWCGMVRCDELGSSVVKASFERVKAAGLRVWLDFNHDDGAAAAWVRSFEWDPALGITCKVEWTPEGVEALTDKSFYSFSPTFWVDWESGRVAGLVEGHAAGGLVNAPAFGAAMPALIAALASGATHKTAPGGTPEHTTAMKDILIKLLAALKVQAPADASEEQLVALYTKHANDATSAQIESLKGELAAVQAKNKTTEVDATAITAMKSQLDALTAAAAAQKKKNAEVAVQAAVDRGAIKADDTALRAKFVSLIEADESNLVVLAAMPGKATPQSVVIASDATQLNSAQSIQVLNASLVDSLKAYSARRSGSERAAIWASSLAPVLRDRSLILGPILAANSLGGLTGDLITQRSLALLKITFPALTAFSTDFSDQSANFNQQIISRTKAVPASGNFVAGTGYGRQNATTTNVPVTISNHKGVEIAFNANELSSTSRDLFGEQVEGCHQRIGLDISAALYALLLNANFPSNTVQAIGGFGRPTLTAIAQALNDLGVPAMGRVALLNSTYFGGLAGDASIVQFGSFQKPELITEYMLPRIAGFQPYEANGLPTNSENLAGFCGTPDALVVATRVPNDYTLALPGAGSGNGSVSTVTNPDTGISVQLVQYVDHAKGESAWRVAYMYGCGKGQANSGNRILTA